MFSLIRISVLNACIHTRYVRDHHVSGCRSLPDGGVYCELCGQWLNGPEQWESHKTDRAHQRRLRRQRRRENDEKTLAPSQGEEEVPDGYVKIPLLAMSGNEIERVLAKSQDTWPQVAAVIADKHPTLCPIPPANARTLTAEDLLAGVQVVVRRIASQVRHPM